MANIGVKGKVTNESGVGIGGLFVIAYDVEVFTDEERLGYTNTSASGDFTVSYASGAYGLELRPDIRVRVFDIVGRLLFESEEYPDVSATTLDIGTIIIPADVARGYRVTLRKGYLSTSPTPPPSDPYPLLSQNNLVNEPMIDNEVAWRELTLNVQNSANFIHLLQLHFDVKKLFVVFNPRLPPIGTPTKGLKLELELLDANRNRGVKARILLDDSLGNSAGSVVNFFNDEGRVIPHSVEVRGFQRPWRYHLHAKLAVIDAKIAHIISGPFFQGYFDDKTHNIDEPRRGTASWIGRKLGFETNLPVHEVGLSIEGPAIEDLNNTFLLLWNHIGAAVGQTAHVPPATTNAAIQIVRTLPGNLLPSIPKGETGILEAYLRAIREAEDFIYLDNQYFTEPAIAKALVLALLDKPKLQVIIVLNSDVDIPLYYYYQKKAINSMKRELENKGALSRLGIFTLWSHEPWAPPTPQRIIRIYTHAKVGIADDKWATIGSANLEGTALHMSQLISPPYTERDRLEKRHIEINALIFNGVDGLPASTVPDEIRRILWAELLGYNDSNHSDLKTPPSGGWLQLWKNHAAAKLEGLKKIPPTGHQARILEWCSERDPEKYLLALGLKKENLGNLIVKQEGRDFDFATGNWR